MAATRNCVTNGCLRMAHPSFQTCCRNCYLSNGKNHDDSCNEKSKCATHGCQRRTHPNVNFCCITCRDTHGQSHGSTCINQLPKQPYVQQTQPYQSMYPNLKFRLDPNAIYFYDVGKPYYEFTNFYAANIVIDGRSYPTTEHYFQANKFKDPNIFNIIVSQPNASAALKEARKYDGYKRQDWERVKDMIMWKALHAKFTQHPNLKTLLLRTGTTHLYEGSYVDNYWGTGADGTGQNKLGRLLMKLRNDINSGGAIADLYPDEQYGGKDKYYKKYLKYKSKYMNLK